MDLAISIVFAAGCLVLAYWLSRRNRDLDRDALEKELSVDFKEEFNLDESFSIDRSPDQVEEFVDWLEDDLYEDSREGD